MKPASLNYSATALSLILALNLVSTVSVPAACTPPPSGLVAWWPGEGNANDNLGVNNGTLQGNITFSNGMVGQAFFVDGIHRDRVDLGNPAGLQLQNFTIEAWVQRASATVSSLDENFQDGTTAGPDGMIFGYGVLGYSLTIADDGKVGMSKVGVDVSYTPAAVTNLNWHHVAVTKSGTSLVFYVDGIQQPTPSLSPYTNTFQFTTSAAIGSRGDAAGNTFFGKIDELAVYSRALSSNEITSIYVADSAGKCTPPPVAPTIVAQPTNLTVNLNGAAIFSVIAQGTAPLFYQWKINGTNLLNRTNASLALTSIQLSQAGNYSVLVSNLAGTVTSSNATLVVVVPSCTPPPSGLVGWWQAESNALDSTGTNNGQLQGGAGYANGQVNRAFSFNGTNQYVRIPRSNSLNTFSNGLTIEFWMQASSNNTFGTFQGLVTADYYGVEISNGSSGPNGLNFYLVNTTGGTFLTSSANGGGLPVSAGQWHHVAGIYDGSKLQLYVDGAPRGNPVAASGVVLPMLANSFVAIGSDDGRSSCDCTGRYFKGLMDEVSIYNRALTTNEIAAIYNASGGGKCVNHPPVAGSPFTMGVTIGVPATVKIIGGKHPPTDADNDALTITGVTGAINGSTSTDGTNVTYTATNGTADSFTYTVNDGHGGTASQTVSVTITSSSSTGFNLLSAQSLGGGTNVLTFLGTPNFRYALERATNLTPPVVWLAQVTNPAKTNGYLIFTNVTSESPVFYRTRYVP